LPQPVAQIDETKDGPLLMSENSKTVEALLLLCYPPAAMPEPTLFKNLDDAFDLGEAAKNTAWMQWRREFGNY
jgi:hypothetical protein